MRKSWLILSVLFVLLLALSSAAFAADLDTANPIKIGYVGALSGDTALWGQAGLNGLNLTAEMINEDGGILGREVQIIGLDGKGAADDSVAAYKRLVEQEGVVAVVGTNFSSCNIPIAAVSDELKVPVIATAASNELVTVDANGNLHPYSFRLCFIDPYMGYLAGSYAYNELGLRKAAIIEDITDPYSTGVGGYMVDTFTSLGGELVAREEAQSGDNDFRAQLTKIAMAQPDVLFVPWNYVNVALIGQQARELGITAVMVGADGWDTNELIELSRGALEGSYYVSRPGFNLPEAAAYFEIYDAKFHSSKETECLYGNDGLMWIKQAIEAAGSADPTAIRDQLEATESFDGLLGHMSVDPTNHNPSRDAAIFRVDADQVSYVGIYDPAK
ncbi:MAG: ABC transporter substrate-binding protein [Anaerolineaceae bacterium]|nr:ABC transporter substrate-binding protein [Anaerolineaceae bacterium]